MCGYQEVNKKYVLLISVVALLSASAAIAHHSFRVVFDQEQPIEVSGKISGVDWKNPHVWFHVDVENPDGETERWSFEMGSPNALVRRGWSHRTLQVGDEVTVAGARARDGSTRGAALSVTLADGRSLFSGQNVEQ